MSNLKPGDVVLVIGGPRRGELTTVVRGPHRYGRDDYPPIPTGSLVCWIDIPSELEPWWSCVTARVEWLLPLLDDSKRAEYLQDLEIDAPSEGVGRG